MWRAECDAVKVGLWPKLDNDVSMEVLYNVIWPSHIQYMLSDRSEIRSTVPKHMNNLVWSTWTLELFLQTWDLFIF